MTRGTEADNDDMNAMNGDNDMKVDAPLNMSNADPLEDDADDALEEAAESERLAVGRERTRRIARSLPSSDGR